MTAWGASAGLWMLLVLGGLMVLTGLPVWALLIGVASAFASFGLLSGTLDFGILSALPARMVGLLEHDLLQALPLYVFIGVLLQHLNLAAGLFGFFQRLFRRSGASSSLAALSLGALIAPMNGSVASSSALLSRLLAPRMRHMPAATATSLISVAATIGVVVPPSLVLILLGDALLRAHTEASNLPGFVLGAQRIINTQDVFNAALLPAVCVLVLWALVAFWQGQKLKESQAVVPVSHSDLAISLMVIALIFGLLGAVFAGKVLAVEAAATGAMLLLFGALLTRALTLAQWQAVLSDALVLSGALFALLVGASTFSLVFRLLGTDRLLAEWALNADFPPLMMAAGVLLGVALCAWVLDAFEMIFVIIPIVAPPLIAKLADAQQVAVLLLLVLQMGFLIPPMGYAVLMARARGGLGPVRHRDVFKALLPFLAAQCALIALVFWVPASVHLLDKTAPLGTLTTPLSDQALDQQMMDMSRQDEPVAEPDKQAEAAK